ncbi:Na+/H+ antiporter NhaA [Corynebacterium lowii]|uniref:Na(+)/H(+) antiporter NhaA n=1 Tax=Corynebacterium lowii TaxID=1544413 RepID=A0A0N8VZC0_9CORY|nr:Na+/H+ antiporter NhaA [Corynebacterium lowii]KQB83474.1 Na(+)/H(+) antiporter NhaA [Corynebacterium lowii]MDP9852520.1 Na+/H+ antiporter NhaA [Corynebacterium lowii]
MKKKIKENDVDGYLRVRSRRSLWVNETYAAAALVIATAIALLWANLGSGYEHFWHTEAGFSLGSFDLNLTLHEWVDEFLMAFFFFMVGLDVKRELVIGELRLPGRALLPVFAALGGLIVPAVIFVLLTSGTSASSAWGTVISTDTAFALGLLALIGPRNAPRLRLFLLALAVIDDIGALTVIGVFYTDELNVRALAAAAILLLSIWVIQRAGVWHMFPYVVLSLLTWYAVYSSGVHATLAGVLIALLLPVRVISRKDLESAHEIYHLFSQAPTPGAAQTVRESMVYLIPMNQRLSDVLPLYVNYLIVPLFALANAGVIISGDTLAAAASSTLTWGVVVGLVGGKLLGITAASALVLRFIPSSRLPGLDLPRIAGIGALSGMGFTISLLVTGLALDDEGQQAQARMGVLGASLLAVIVAAVIFRLGDRFRPLSEPKGETLVRPVDPQYDHFVGNPNAKVSLVHYTAMTHGYRTRMEETLREAYDLVDREQISIVYRHHVENSDELLPALALEAAHRQNKFFEMHAALVNFPGDLGEEEIYEQARKIGLNMEEFEASIMRADDMVRIQDDNLDVEEIESEGESIVYLNGRRVEGPMNRWRLMEEYNRLVKE